MSKYGKGYDHIDDAAAAALFAIATKPLSRRQEFMGALYAEGEGYARTPTVTTGRGNEVKGWLAVPKGTLRALFHNHPDTGPERERAAFSDDDTNRAKALGIPSYISAGDRVRRYDPRSNGTADVLAQFPIDEWRSHIMRTMLGRSPDDPRGAYR